MSCIGFSARFLLSVPTEDFLPGKENVIQLPSYFSPAPSLYTLILQATGHQDRIRGLRKRIQDTLLVLTWLLSCIGLHNLQRVAWLSHGPPLSEHKWSSLSGLALYSQYLELLKECCMIIKAFGSHIDWFIIARFRFYRLGVWMLLIKPPWLQSKSCYCLIIFHQKSNPGRYTTVQSWQVWFNFRRSQYLVALARRLSRWRGVILLEDEVIPLSMLFPKSFIRMTRDRADHHSGNENNSCLGWFLISDPKNPRLRRYLFQTCYLTHLLGCFECWVWRRSKVFLVMSVVLWASALGV